ncbi:uncharacterized protein MELLADRAFT_109196 [Melampsora larici-populina 98AG31]|uniref:Uncharacterized protein n=1 Tax=Melampsora larici-populina (strain 98AG31 / pathotype 3-4-7) TaxID=747676 RepID=F4RVP4_MELLP|nr:uncharacterized protein MELLADRAFT_109196 [Melampsora larici-populina 98AG31]EGG03392.1 hypothetical protein MELLADRAFT_109196 [Melampsora larici-populina 98AG31]
MTISRTKNQSNESYWIGLQHSLIDLRFRGSYEDHESSSSNLKLTQSLVEDYCSGQWKSILENAQVRRYFQINETVSVIPIELEDDLQFEIISRLTVVATLLSIFVQVNFTGPIFDVEPSKVFNSEIDESNLNSISLSELSLAGEPAYHLTKSATFLCLAIKLIESLSLIKNKKGVETLAWWELRAGILHRKLIESQIPFSDELFLRLDELLIDLKTNSSENSNAQDLLPMLTLERGLAEHLIGNDKAANQLFLRAAEEAGLEYELTGILGKRTKFQEQDLSQLVLLAKGRTRTPFLNTQPDLSDSLSPTKQSVTPITLALNDDTLLEKTQFTSTTSSMSSLSIDPKNQPELHPLDQSILLALSLSIKNTSPSHGLTKAQIAPFIERVLENPANWSVHSMALLVRSRLEAHRSRTVERGLLQLQALVDQLTKEAENDPVDRCTAKERVRWCWTLELPSKWDLERQLGRKLIGLGVIRSAMEIFERLEMWEDVVQCHLTLDSKPIGIQLVKDLINGQKIESDLKMSKTRSNQDGKRLGKLWCLLGELESDPTHWKTAWEISEHTSSRAMRSLGAYHFSKGSYTESYECLSTALKINPLFAKTWFICGCAAMRLENWEDAEMAFRRCISLDDEDAEAWNNLATVYLKQANTEEPTTSHQETSTSHPQDPKADLDSDEDDEDIPVPMLISRTTSAFHALQQAVKISYDSWRMWTNYMIVGMSIGEYSESIRALGRVIEIRGEDGLDLDVLEKLIQVSIISKNSLSNEEEAIINSTKIFDRLKDVMNRIVLIKCSKVCRVWELMSNLCECVQDYKSALEHQLTAYRVGVSQVTELWTTNLTSWKIACEIVERTLDRLETIGSKLNDEEVNWKWQVKSILRGFLSRSKNSFEDEERWVLLDSRLKSIKQG